jgi:hypothetical protein
MNDLFLAAQIYAFCYAVVLVLIIAVWSKR